MSFYTEKVFPESLGLIHTSFCEAYQQNFCEVIDDSKSLWFYSKKYNKLVMLDRNTSTRLTTQDTGVVCRELYCSTEGVLLGLFSCPCKRRDQENSDLEREEFDLPNLLANSLSNLDLEFNPTRSLLWNYFSSTRNYLVDESQPHNFSVYIDQKQKASLPSKFKEFVSACRRFFLSKISVHFYREGISLAFSPTGCLVDILKYNESPNLLLRGEFDPDFIKERIWLPQKSTGSFVGQKIDHLSQCLMAFQDKKEAMSMYSQLKSNINIERTEITYENDQAHEQSSTLKKENWFICFTFYFPNKARLFELRFPNYHCFRKSLDLVRENREFRIIDHKEFKEDPLRAMEHELFYNGALKTKDYSGQQDRSIVQARYWIVKCSINESFEERSEPDIYRMVKECLQDLDFALLFEPSGGLPRIESEIFKKTFADEFSEFNYNDIKYALFPNYSTVQVTVLTQSVTDLKERFYPILELYKDGRETVKLRLNVFELKLPDRRYVCFAKMGRIVHEEVPYSAMVNFKDAITETQNYVKIYPSLNVKLQKYTLYSYVSFREKRGLLELEKLRQLIRPRQIKLTIPPEMTVTLEELKTKIRSKAKSLLSPNEAAVPRLTEESIFIDVYSPKEQNIFIELVDKMERELKKILADVAPIMPSAVLNSTVDKIEAIPRLNDTLDMSMRDMSWVAIKDQIPDFINSKDKVGSDSRSILEEGNTKVKDKSSNSAFMPNPFKGEEMEESGIGKSEVSADNSLCSGIGKDRRDVMSDVTINPAAELDRKDWATGVSCSRDCSPLKCDQFMLLSCGHSFCREGLTKGVKSILHGHERPDPFKIICPGPRGVGSCNSYILFEELKQLVKLPYLERKFPFVIYKFLMKNYSKFQECPIQECSNIIRWEDNVTNCELCHSQIEFAKPPQSEWRYLFSDNDTILGDDNDILGMMLDSDDEQKQAEDPNNQSITLSEIETKEIRELF